MADRWERHTLEYPDSFDVRRPVLDAMGSLRDRWRLSDDGKYFEHDIPLSSYSPHERAVLEFAMDPHVMAANIFHNLDAPVRRALAKAIATFFGV